MLHSDLILASKPLAYYPLDGDRLNYVDQSKFAGGGSTVYDGSSETSPGVFFKGQPLVKGLRNACHIKTSSHYVTIPNHGLFARLVTPDQCLLSFTTCLTHTLAGYPVSF